MQDIKVAAGIVIFNPDNLERVEKCLKSVSDQVKQIYIFDNSTISHTVFVPENVIYISENKNRGLAYALNKIMECAKRDGYKWVLTVDQDSVLPDGMVNDFKQYMNSNIAIICPQVVDKRRAYIEVKEDDSVRFINKCITSAGCTSVEAWEKVGRFDEWLFVDLIDNEFCKRLIVSGYKIIQVRKWILDQEFGKIVPKSEKSQKFWLWISRILHNVNFAKFSYKKEVSPLRVYYTCRNIIYVNRKLKLHGTLGYESYNCKSYTGFIISFVLPSILRANKKSEVISAAFRGTKDGLAKEVVQWKAENLIN